MYQLIGVTRLLGFYAIAVALLAVVIGERLDAGPVEWLRYISTSGTIIAGIAYILGETPLFPWLCRRRPISWVFPDIDGQWVGQMASNWPRIANRGAVEPPPLKPVEAAIRIKARFFSLHLHLITTDKYSESETIVVGIRKKESGDIVLAYLYNNLTKHPEQTDCQQHDGAGLVNIRTDGAAPTIDGVYWTNRNWAKGLNTAGTVEWRKV